MHLPNGLLNVSACKYDSPAYVSFPHFYLADPALLDQFHNDSDLNPNEEEHSAYLSLMPKQGIPLEVAIRMQINILYRYQSTLASPRTYFIYQNSFRPFTGFPIHMFEDTEPTFYPAVWFETTTELPDDLASQLRLLEYEKHKSAKKKFLFNNLPGGFLLWATSWAASLPGSVFSLSLRSMQTEVAGSEFSQVSSILIRSCKVAWEISSLKVATTCDKAC